MILWFIPQRKCGISQVLNCLFAHRICKCCKIWNVAGFECILLWSYKVLLKGKERTWYWSAGLSSSLVGTWILCVTIMGNIPHIPLHNYYKIWNWICFAWDCFPHHPSCRCTWRDLVKKVKEMFTPYASTPLDVASNITCPTPTEYTYYVYYRIGVGSSHAEMTYACKIR